MVGKEGTHHMNVVRRTLAACLLLFGVAVGTASAATIQVSLLNVTDAGGGVYDWNYEAVLTTDSRVDGTDMANPNPARFVIYDFAGFQGYANPGDNPDWQFNSQLVGPVPIFQNPNDAADLLNMVFTYIGENSIDNIEGATPINLGTFTLQSTFSNVNFVTGNYSSEDTREINETTGATGPGGHTAPIQVPGNVPEPASLLLLGAGMLGLAARLRKR